jgi:hypothetical protein
MQAQRFAHILTLKMTREMRDDIDNALLLVQDTLVRTRSEFLRMACQFALDSLAGECNDVPVDIEERKNRVLAGADELDADGSEQVRAPANAVCRH